MIPNQIIIHHSASLITYTLEQMAADHKARFGLPSTLGGYIGYHYIIQPYGNVVQTRRDYEIGAHCPPNDGRIGICLIGNFQIGEPKDAQLEALTALVNQLKNTYNIDEVWGHRDCRSTECPGDNLYKYVTKYTEINWLQRQIKKLLMPKSND